MSNSEPINKYIACTTNPNVVPYYVGPMNTLCQYCNALRFTNESLNFCHNGKVNLPQLSSYPVEFRDLQTSNTSQAKNFREHIRQYNSSFAFASLGANIDKITTKGPYCFRIYGQLYHRSGCLHPSKGNDHQYGQLYILEGDQAVEHQSNSHCKPETMRLIQKAMETISPYAAAYRHMYEVEQEQIRQFGVQTNSIKMIFKRGNDQRRYNKPHHDEVAAVFVGDEGAPPCQRDITVYPKDTPCQIISYMSANCDPMCYPLIFPRGDLGWIHGMQHTHEYRTSKRHAITLLQFYSYRLAIRPTFSAIHYAGKLFQQYVVDAYVKTEASRLDYIRRSFLRVELYQGLMDHLHSEAEERNMQPGRMVILPSSFHGSPRAMQQNYQDAMAIIAKFGKPDLFITFTCNPKSQSIMENLPPGVAAANRPDLVARVFKRLRDNFKNYYMILDIDMLLVSQLLWCMCLSFKREDYPIVIS